MSSYRRDKKRHGPNRSHEPRARTRARLCTGALAALIAFSSCARTLETVPLSSPAPDAGMDQLVEHEQKLDTLVGRDARVRMNNGRDLRGELVEVTPAELVIRESSPERTVRVARCNIRSFELIETSQKTAWALAATLVAITAVGLLGFFDVFDPLSF